MTVSPANYTDEDIKSLSSLDHIRLRPGMYIGRLGNGNTSLDGIYVLIKEVIDNSIDEYIMGCGKKVEITLDGRTVTVRDYGRGIPQGKLVECVSHINTGGKFNSDAFQFSVGMNGVGTKAVNALSSLFIAESFRDGKQKTATFNDGVLASQKTVKSNEPNGTRISFIASDAPELFGNYEYRTEFIEKRLWRYAYLNAGLNLYLNGARFYSKNGLLDLIENEVGENKLYPIIHSTDKNIEFAFCHVNNFDENYQSFVNGQYTNDGGTHLSAFKEGVLKGVNEYAASKGLNGDDVRKGIVGAIAIRIKDPIFESQTKNKLGNNDIKSWIIQVTKDAVQDFLHKNEETAKYLMDKVEQNEKVRKEVAAVKKKSKENVRKMSLKIPKLKDCKYHYSDSIPEKKRAERAMAEESSIFLTEGDSAAGSMIQCRNVYTQAIFSLKGKPQNVFNLSGNSQTHKLETLYKNEELFYIMQALGIEDGVDNLRYNRVIIATDADTDGMHIRILLLTFFLTYFEQLVRSGHVYILDTPLYRVRNKTETIYCYNDTDRDAAMAKLGKSAELTRFKGLGEISPKEFGQFIGKDIRLQNVAIDHMNGIDEMLRFYMGPNTPERKTYLLENLV